MKALLLAISCLVLLAVACGGKDLDTNNASSGGSSAAGSAGPDTGPLQAGSALPSAQFLPDRLVITTNLDVEVNDLQLTYATIIGSDRELGGFVAEARFSDDEDEYNGSAFLRLRVPATRHDEMVASLRRLADADVKREESAANEVTAEYTDLRSRLVNLQVTEAQYQEFVGRASTIDEVLKVTAKLDEVRAEIEQVEGRIKLIENQTDHATIAVRLSLPVATASSGGLSSPVEVLTDSLSTSLAVAHAILNLMIVLVVAGLWLIPAGLMVVLAGRLFRRQLEAFKGWLG